MNHSHDSQAQHGEGCDSMKKSESHGGHGMSHGSASVYLKRFWIVTFLLIPLVLTHEKIVEYTGLNFIGLSKWVQFGIATIIMGFLRSAASR